MSKRKKKKQHSDHVDESWLLPYADLLTLLLAVFIVLFAMSEVDSKKFEAMASSFNDEFTGGAGAMANDSKDPDPEAAVTMDLDKGTEEPVDEETDQSELELIQQKVNDYIKENNLTDKLDTKLTEEGLLISIRDNVLFGSGSAKVRENDLQIASEISDLLVLNPPRNIIISGHTDNVPIQTAKFSSNWELSVMRSINFMKILLQNDQLDPRWFSAKGFGEFKPVADNSTAEGRSQNRRVEILILPRTGN